MKIFDERIVVEKIQPSEKSKAQHADDFKLFLYHFKLILENEDLIIRTPEYFHVLLERLFLGTTITGTTYLPLGVLLLLWRDRDLLCCCPQCSSKSYIFQAGGSLLSGSHSYSAICPECERVFCGRASSFQDIHCPIFKKVKKYPNTRTIKIRKTQGFSWSKGLVGEPTPDAMLEDGIHPISLKTLIGKLKKKEREMANEYETG
jgi:hypothetical protein